MGYSGISPMRCYGTGHLFGNFLYGAVRGSSSWMHRYTCFPLPWLSKISTTKVKSLNPKKGNLTTSKGSQWRTWEHQHRRVSFPMGCYGAPTLKMTVFPSIWIYLCFFFCTWHPTIPEYSTDTLHHSPAMVCHLRLWGTAKALSTLARPLDIRMLKAALARRISDMVCGGMWSLYGLIKTLVTCDNNNSIYSGPYVKHTRPHDHISKCVTFWISK